MSYNETAVGTVKYVNGPNDYGFFSLKIEGHDKAFGIGKAKPSVSVGDTVELKYKVNAKGYPEADQKSVKRVDGAQAAYNASPKQLGEQAAKAVIPYAPNTSGGMSKDDYWRRKEERDLLVQNEIRIQASRNAGIAFMQLLMNTEDPATGKPFLVIPEPTAKNRTKVDAAKLFLDKITDQFYKDTLAVNKTDEKTTVVEGPGMSSKPEEF